VGIRIIKTALAAIIAIYTAVYLKLDPPLGAGILAILGVEVSRMKGLKSAVQRFVASSLGLFFASLVFTIFGFHIWVVALFILMTFPVLARFQLKDGIVTSAVIVFQLFAHGEVTVDVLENEVLLMIVGLGWATIINFIYMPKDQHLLESLKASVERLFGVIFTEMALNLRNPSHIWNGSELLEVHRMIEEGARRAVLNKENRVFGQEHYWSTYFEMRRLQLESMQVMLEELALVYEKLPQNEPLAEILELLSEEVKSEVYRGITEKRLSDLRQLYRTMELPRTRDEFELRAAIFKMRMELERYLEIAKRLKKRDVMLDKAEP
jgi:Predicted membrane protein